MDGTFAAVFLLPIIVGIIQHVNLHEANEESAAPNYESGGQEFESLRARQILAIHRNKWHTERCAMQNG
jgi:hypothetical protein